MKTRTMKRNYGGGKQMLYGVTTVLDFSGEFIKK